MNTDKETTLPKPSLNFIQQIVEEDIKNGKHEARIHTRFPPEPNGHLHIGHAKAICLDFGIAQQYKGLCNLRFDDTNPEKEGTEYVESIKRDVKWLGFDWENREYYASDYFEQLFELAVQLIKKNKAYVDDSSSEEINKMRGIPTETGVDSPFRSRTIEENLDLFQRMRAGDFPDGSKTVRAKIDMSSPNMHMRDPVIYRIRRVEHHRTANKWCIYPMYDFTHCLSDSIEKITHSLCTLEFEVHRPLYDWFIKELEMFPSRQIEFARLNLSYTVMSKRMLMELVEGGFVNGWDDPRMPTISGLRRRGFTAASIRNFADKIGIAKRDGIIDVALLEHSVREYLNKTAKRVMAVLNPLKVVITNYPDSQEEELEAINNPEDDTMGTRKVPFSRELFIEQDDFMEEPSNKYFRLSPDKEVRLRYAYYITCVDVIKDSQGNITELHCTYDPETKGGKSADGRKIKGTLHWVSAKHAVDVEARLYDRLFSVENPLDTKEGGNFKDFINSDSLKVIPNVKAEPIVKNVLPEDKFQFERKGYFCVDKESNKEKIIFNQTVPLRDSWEKILK